MPRCIGFMSSRIPYSRSSWPIFSVSCTRCATTISVRDNS